MSAQPLSLELDESAGQRLTPFGIVRDLVSLSKPRLSSLVLVTTSGGYLLAPGSDSLWQVLKVVGATALLVASANTLNCVLEAKIDGSMHRTRARALASARVPRGGDLPRRQPAREVEGVYGAERGDGSTVSGDYRTEDAPGQRTPFIAS